MRIEVQAKIIITIQPPIKKELPEVTVLATENYLNHLTTFTSPEGNIAGIRVHIDGKAPKVIK